METILRILDVCKYCVSLFFLVPALIQIIVVFIYHFHEKNIYINLSRIFGAKPGFILPVLYLSGLITAWATLTAGYFLYRIIMPLIFIQLHQPFSQILSLDLTVEDVLGIRFLGFMLLTAFPLAVLAVIPAIRMLRQSPSDYLVR